MKRCHWEDQKSGSEHTPFSELATQHAFNMYVYVGNTVTKLYFHSDFCSYRPVAPPAGAGNSKVLSTSLPSSTHLDPSSASASPGIGLC